MSRCVRLFRGFETSYSHVNEAIERFLSSSGLLVASSVVI